MARNSNKIIVLDVGGTVFRTEISTLKTIPDSLLAKLDERSEYYNSETNTYYFDRDPHAFKQILNTYRHGELHITRDVCPQQFRHELDFWRVPIRFLSPCCWKAFYKTEYDLDVISTLLKRVGHCMYGTMTPTNFELNKPTTNSLTSKDKNGDTTDMMRQDSKVKKITALINHKADDHFKHRKPKTRTESLWLILEEPRSSLFAKVWCYIYLAVVMINVIIILVWAEPGTRVDSYLDGGDNTSLVLSAADYRHLQRLTFTDPHLSVFVIDLICMLFFIVEAVLHFWVCPNKSQYPKDFYNIVKVVLCMTMVLTLTLDLNKLNLTGEGIITFTLMLRSLGVLRLLLIFRLHKVYQGLDILLLSMKQSFRELSLLIFAISVLVVIYGIIMFSAEIGTDEYPNVWIAMWWSIITMTTVGYGDFHPTSSFGYIIGTLCAVNGLLVLAMPVAAVAGNFGSLYSRHNDIQKHQEAIRFKEEKSTNQIQGSKMGQNTELVDMKNGTFEKTKE